MPRSPNGTRKKRLNVTVDLEAFDWVMARINEHAFANQSHAVEFCIFKVMESEKRERP